MQQIVADTDRIEGFRSLITNNEIYGELNDSMTIQDKVEHVYMREVTKTFVDGRYSGKATQCSCMYTFHMLTVSFTRKTGYLQILLLSGLLKTSICQHCCNPGYELYNSEVCPQVDTTKVIHLLWCHLSGDVVNHIVPMIKCETSESKNLNL